MHRASFGVERICRTLQIPPSTYYAAKARPMSARARRDTELLADIRRVYDTSGGSFGARRVWQELLGEGIDVARCTVERLMRAAGLAGVSGNRKGGERHEAGEPIVQIGA
jgi:putative transposase